MKRLTIALAALIVTVIFFPFSAKADNNVSELGVDVVLQEDGSAKITQVFTADTDEGTEFYLDYLNSGYLSITDFAVSDENGAYTVVDDWDVDASFEEKANKCGMVSIDGGDELCWGITEYGEHQYTVEYVLHDLVGGYTDADGFNYRFVNADLGFFPTDVTIAIYTEDGTPLSEDNCAIWAFGYDGQIDFEDGVIYAWTDSALSGSENMTILVQLDKGVLSPTRTVEDSFEPVKEAAMDGSDYAEDDISFFELVLIVLACLVIFILIIAFVVIVQTALMNRRMKNTPYFRDLPNGGNLNITYQIGKPLDLCKEGSLLGARILKLIAEGCLVPLSESVDSREVSLVLDHEPGENGDDFDRALYDILVKAAGDDGILQPKELKKYSYKHWKTLYKFWKKCAKNGNNFLINNECIKGAECTGMRSLTENGKKELAEILGFKRYLLDFSLIREKDTQETVIWQDYMSYAMMLGIADKVAEQIRELYPQQVPQIEAYSRQITWAECYCSVMYENMERHHREAERARSEGKGGHASYGGGGGFSGGGGGGTR